MILDALKFAIDSNDPAKKDTALKLAYNEILKFSDVLDENEIKKVLATTILDNNLEDEEIAIQLSGRLIEEVVELHLESGGTPESAMLHVMDAVANEANKASVKLGVRVYPSEVADKFNREEVKKEICDARMLLVMLMMGLRISNTHLQPVMSTKLEKITRALKEDRLHRTGPYQFYIRKGDK